VLNDVAILNVQLKIL